MAAKRASWNIAYEKGLIDTLHEHNTPNFKGQNGWAAEGWRQIVSKFNEKFPFAKFTKQQVQGKEKELKGNYKAIRDARKQSGIGWDESLGMIIAEPKIWEMLTSGNPKLNFFLSKAFPHFNSLALLYEGSVATGDLNYTSLPTVNSSSDKASHGDAIDLTDDGDAGKNPFDILDAHKEGVDEAEPHTSSTSSAQKEESTGKKRKPSQIAGVLGDYLDFKKQQTQKLIEKIIESPKKEDDKYSFAKCWDILDTMEGITYEKKAKAMKVLKCPMNRELVIEAKKPVVRLLWLKGLRSLRRKSNERQRLHALEKAS